MHNYAYWSFEQPPTLTHDKVEMGPYFWASRVQSFSLWAPCSFSLNIFYLQNIDSSFYIFFEQGSRYHRLALNLFFLPLSPIPPKF